MQFHHSSAVSDNPREREREREPDEAQRLLREDLFDGVVSDDELSAIVAKFSSTTSAPHAEVVKRMLGIERIAEPAAKVLVREMVVHRQTLSAALGRHVHMRVAALDFMTLRKHTSVNERESHPIIVTTALIERALEEASADGVTGLPQRAQFMNIVRHELRQRRRRTVAVAFVDLDGFKRVNDSYGHARGDQVLRTLARAAKDTLRTGDIIARIGGDEFALLLLDVNDEAATAIVERLRARFEAGTERYGTSFSAGIALAEPGETAEETLGRADANMYRDKRARERRRRGASAERGEPHKPRHRTPVPRA